MYIEAQTKSVCQQVVQKKLQQSQSTPTSLCHNEKTTAIRAYAYIEVTAPYNKQTVK